MERLFGWIPAPAPDPDPGFAGMTVHTANRKPTSIEDSLNLPVMRGKAEAPQTISPSPSLSLHRGRGIREEDSDQ